MAPLSLPKLVRPASAGDTGIGMAGFGVQFTYYLMPANVYLSLTPAVTWTSLAANGADADTRPGFGLKVGVGKEWWVGAHWGLGLAAQLVLGVNEDKGSPPSSWTTLGGGVALSATYN